MNKRIRLSRFPCTNYCWCMVNISPRWGPDPNHKVSTTDSNYCYETNRRSRPTRTVDPFALRSISGWNRVWVLWMDGPYRRIRGPMMRYRPYLVKNKIIYSDWSWMVKLRTLVPNLFMPSYSPVMGCTRNITPYCRWNQKVLVVQTKVIPWIWSILSVLQIRFCVPERTIPEYSQSMPMRISSLMHSFTIIHKVVLIWWKCLSKWWNHCHICWMRHRRESCIEFYLVLL